jgi:hypothetical protein
MGIGIDRRGRNLEGPGKHEQPERQIPATIGIRAMEGTEDPGVLVTINRQVNSSGYPSIAPPSDGMLDANIYL